MAKRKRKYGLSFNLTCMEPFAEQNTRVVELIQEMISFLEPYGDKYLECPEAWARPQLFNKPIKYKIRQSVAIAVNNNGRQYLIRGAENSTTTFRTMDNVKTVRYEVSQKGDIA